MNILVINCGSSSLKYQLIDSQTEDVLAKGLVERIGIDGSCLTHTPAGKDKVVIKEDIPDHNKAVKMVTDALTDASHGVIKSLEEISAVGHRVVHGGEKFDKAVIIDDSVLKDIEALNDLAPLHNPANLIGINSCTVNMPGVPQVAVFDTAFHQTMPKKAYLYGLPMEYYEKYKVRRYGFHGTSHRYVSQRALEILGMKAEGTKMITCHIGNGGSITAIKDGKSVDTSMGMTPLEGLVMGTRAGDVDAGAVTFLMEAKGYDVATMSNILNKKSGLLGISGVSSDMREVEAAVEAGNERAKLAVDMYGYRIRKYIGAYAAAMGGVDTIIFTAGVGENSASQRMAIASGLEFMGVKMDEDANKVRGEERVISAIDSKVKVLLIPTNEELMIAQDTMELCSGK